MDLNEQMDQNAADFSKVPPPPPVPGAGPNQAPNEAVATDGLASKSVTKAQVLVVVGLLLAVLGIFYYLLTKPKSQRPKGYVPPPAIPSKNVPKNK